MCDMDCGDGGGFDVGTDFDVSEGTDFESGSDVDVESSFDGIYDVSGTEDFEGNVESFEAAVETAGFDADMEYEDEHCSLDEFDDVGDVDDFSQELDEVDETVGLESAIDKMPEIDIEMVEDTERGTNDELMMELAQLDDVEPEMMDAAYLEELKQTNADNPEFIAGINRLIDEGKINVVDSSEIVDEISGEEDDVKVLTREMTEEVLESRERDTEEVLDNYRENLETRGVAEEQIEEFLDQERDKINTEYESLDIGDTSSNIYEIPSDWDAIADALLNQEATDVGTDLHDSIDVSDDMVEIPEESELEQIEYETNDNRLDEVAVESSELIDERISDETGIDTEVEEIEEEPNEENALESLTDDIEEAGEVQEIAINYDEIYEQIQQEALEQGFEDIDILMDTERLDGSLENFEESNWENLSLEEQKESLSNLAEYVEETIGFENPPKIEYYNNPREGDYGGYNSATNTFRINEYMLYNSSEAVDTIAHELWHAHQRECAEKPQVARDYQYQYNFENYITPELDHQAYENQLIEAEARAFAAQFKGRLASISRRSQ